VIRFEVCDAARRTLFASPLRTAWMPMRAAIVILSDGFFVRIEEAAYSVDRANV
jgi:hypothetical protein